MPSDEKLKIDLALKIIEGIDWNVETITVIQSKINVVQSILSHVDLYKPGKRDRHTYGERHCNICAGICLAPKPKRSKK